MLSWFFRMLGIYRDAQALQRGPGASARRRVRRSVHRGLAHWLRKL